MIIGGQDDLVSLISFRGPILARFQGHVSFVKDVAFNVGDSTSKAHRFTSVGDDGLVCFWEFPVPPMSSRSLSLRRLNDGSVDKMITSVSTVHHARKSKNDLAIIEPFAVRSLLFMYLTH